MAVTASASTGGVEMELELLDLAAPMAQRRERLGAAGTHVRSRRSGVAAVGNVLTRLSYRDRGMATSVTSAVTTTALEQHADVVLNVRQDNAPAISVYTRLGYRRHAQFIEGPAVRRNAFDRLIGRIR